MSAPIHFLVDEDFDNDILRALLCRKLGLDILRVKAGRDSSIWIETN